MDQSLLCLCGHRRKPIKRFGQIGMGAARRDKIGLEPDIVENRIVREPLGDVGVAGRCGMN